jgi:hypothetical protein
MGRWNSIMLIVGAVALLAVAIGSDLTLNDRLRAGLNDRPNGVRGSSRRSFGWRPGKRQRGVSFW